MAPLAASIVIPTLGRPDTLRTVLCALSHQTVVADDYEVVVSVDGLDVLDGKDAGFGKRILFGSDQMVWPHTIAVAIDTIEQAPFLSAAQKRDIFYNNAVRFLRLPKP